MANAARVHAEAVVHLLYGELAEARGGGEGGGAREEEVRDAVGSGAHWT